MRVFAVRVSFSFGNGCYGICGHDKYQCLHLVRSWICTWRQPTTRTKHMVNVRSSISHCQISFRHPLQVHSKCSFQRTLKVLSHWHSVPFPSLKALSHWHSVTLVHHLKSYPIDSQSTAKHSDPSIPEYKISHCQISFCHPFHHSNSYPSNSQPTSYSSDLNLIWKKACECCLWPMMQSTQHAYKRRILW